MPKVHLVQEMVQMRSRQVLQWVRSPQLRVQVPWCCANGGNAVQTVQLWQGVLRLQTVMQCAIMLVQHQLIQWGPTQMLRCLLLPPGSD